jgi:hypothetical protein
MTCLILQDGSKSARDQSHAAEHPSRSGDDMSGCESESVEDPSTQVPQKWWTRKSYYVPPPPEHINSESRPVIKSISDR